MATSTKQVVATVPVYDYLQNPGDATLTSAPPLSGKQVKVTLAYDKARSISPVTWLENLTVYSTKTDQNGFWQVNVVPTDNITPSGTYYIVEIDGYLSYKINPTQAGVPGIGWQSSAILIDIPASLTPAGQTITGPLTVNGTLAITGLLTVVSATGMQVDALGNVSARSFTASAGSGPYTSTAVAGGSDLSKPLRLAGGPWIDATHPSFAGGMKIDSATDDSAALVAAAAATPTRGTTLIPPGVGTGTAVLNTAASFTPGWIPAEVTVMCMVILNLGTNVELDLDNIGAKWIGGVISYATSATDQYAMRMGKTRTSIQGVRFILGGGARTAAIRVSYARNAATAGTLTGGSILFCYFDAIGYGVLKQGSNSVTVDWLLADCMYVNGSGGDAIEWNGDGTPADFQLLVTGWIIDGIARGGVVFAGIGIGITTGAYGLSDITEYQRFTFTGNIINNGAEGIHIEACSRFSASGNVIANMAVTADLTGAGIIAYGSRYFALRANEVSDCTIGIQVSYGLILGVYYFPDRFTIGNNDVAKCGTGIQVFCEGSANLARVVNNDLSECTVGFSLRGQCNWIWRDNTSIGAGSHVVNGTAISGGGSGLKFVQDRNLLLDVNPTYTLMSAFAYYNPAGPAYGPRALGGSAYLAVTVALTAGASQKIKLDTKLYDDNSNWDVATNNRWTCPVAGYYMISGGCATSPSARFFASCYKNGANLFDGQEYTALAAATHSTFAAIRLLAVGDYLELWVFNQGNIQNVGVGQGTTWLDAWFLGVK